MSRNLLLEQGVRLRLSSLSRWSWARCSCSKRKSSHSRPVPLHRHLLLDGEEEIAPPFLLFAGNRIAERFAAFVGESPMQYLTSWRMRLAARQLRTSGAPLVRIAEEVGYESEAAFIRAFRREFGVPPGNWRRGLKNGGARMRELSAVPQDA